MHYQESETIVLAAKKSDRDFQQIQLFLQEYGIRAIPLFSYDQLSEVLDCLQDCSLLPSAIVLGVTSTREPVVELVSRIKKMDKSIAVVIATANGSREFECRVRCAGIFYYMTLPAGREEVQKVALSALRTHRRCKAVGNGEV